MSVDHAVLERTQRAAMVPAAFSWSDIGSWDALWDRASRDGAGNDCHGDVQLHGVSNSYVHSSHRLVVGIGLEDTVVVETPDAVLVARRGDTQRVREAVEQLKTSGRGEHKMHRLVHRPWGTYEDIDQGDRFRVKRITVAPGAMLSLQLHHHRAEHWIVVRGTAKVTRGEQVSLLSENQSIYIEIGQLHRLENPGKIPLQLIEVQTGSYLGEDDIVRVEDVYQRVESRVSP
jgi:mannose-1-phosphate guanylyltransferase/mannose-6-phosphate isomerase